MARTRDERRIAVCTFAAFLLLLAINFLIPLRRQRIPEGTVEITFLDVGQADATLIVSGDSAMLIDAGDADSAAYVCEAVRRFAPLDCLLLTHGHSDHAGGAKEVLRRKRVKQLLLPLGADASEEFSEILETAQRYGVPVDYLAARDSFDLGSVHFTVLAPLTAGTDGNEDCLVLRMDHGTVSALFTADATEKSEAEQLQTYTEEHRADLLDIDILKAGHHGSDSSSCAAYLAALTPSAAYVSCGLNNMYGHPGRSLLERLNALDIPIYRTDLDGTIRVISDGVSFRTVTE